LLHARSWGGELIVTMRSGTREVMVRDPDVGGFVELFEQPKKEASSTASR
jgi:hypothetical protein